MSSQTPEKRSRKSVVTTTTTATTGEITNGKSRDETDRHVGEKDDRDEISAGGGATSAVVKDAKEKKERRKSTLLSLPAAATPVNPETTSQGPSPSPASTPSPSFTREDDVQKKSRKKLARLTTAETGSSEGWSTPSSPATKGKHPLKIRTARTDDKAERSVEGFGVDESDQDAADSPHSPQERHRRYTTNSKPVHPGALLPGKKSNSATDLKKNMVVVRPLQTPAQRYSCSLQSPSLAPGPREPRGWG